MGEPKTQQLDHRLLVAGYVMTAVGCSVLLMCSVQPGLGWLVGRDRADPVLTMVWVFGFAMLGVAMIGSGSRLRRAYRAGMQLGL
jgi:hypothetical protein